MAGGLRVGITSASERSSELSALIRNIEDALDGRAQVFPVRDHSRFDARRLVRWLRDLDVWIGVGPTAPRLCAHGREAGVRSVIVAAPESQPDDAGARVRELAEADACVVYSEAAARALERAGLGNVVALPLAPAAAFRQGWWALLRRVGPKLLNLGAGAEPHPGMLNLDIRALPGIQIVASASALPFRDASFDGLLAQDLLEHFPASQIDALLDEWVRVLRPGARLRVQTPDVRALARALLRGRLSTERTIEWLYGAQDHAFNFHQTGFDEPRLRALLETRGIVELRRDRSRVSSKNVCLEGRRSTDDEPG